MKAVFVDFPYGGLERAYEIANEGDIAICQAQDPRRLELSVQNSVLNILNFSILWMSTFYASETL